MKSLLLMVLLADDRLIFNKSISHRNEPPRLSSIFQFGQLSFVDLAGDLVFANRSRHRRSIVSSTTAIQIVQRNVFQRY